MMSFLCAQQKIGWQALLEQRDVQVSRVCLCLQKVPHPLVTPLSPALLSSSGIQKKMLVSQRVASKVYSMLRNSPAVIGKYGRNIVNIWGRTFLVENDFNLQNEPCPHNFRITKHSHLRMKWKGTDMSPVASDFMTLHFLDFLIIITGHSIGFFHYKQDFFL